MRRAVAMMVLVVSGAATLAGSSSSRDQQFAGNGEQFTANEAKVDAIFAQYTQPDSPGCSVSVARDGKLLFTKGYGSADLEHNVAITPDTVFYLASVSKQFTGISIGILIQRGVVKLDDDVRKWVPEMPDFGTTVTVSHLLHHTGGVRDFLGLQGLAGFPPDEPLTEREFLAMMSRQKALNFAPGAEHLYSNSGYALLAIIVKRATTSSLKEFAAKEVLAPLGMTMSRFRDDHTEPISNRAIGYSPRNGGFRQNVPTFDVVGDGGLFSSARELAMWDPTDLPSTIGKAGLSQLISAPGTLNNGTSVPYAMGLRIDTYRGLPILRHGGSYGGYQTDVTRFPGNRMGVTVLCNQSDARAWQWGQGGLAQKVADVFFADRFTAPVPAPPPPAIPPAVPTLRTSTSGNPIQATMFSEELDTSWAISVWDGRVLLTKRNQAQLTLARDKDADTYTSPSLTIHLTRDASGKIIGMTADAGEIKGIRFVALPAK